MRDFLYSLYLKFQSIIIPNLEHSQQIYGRVLKGFFSSDSTWLDLGCGHQVFRHWLGGDESQLTKKFKLIVGLDFDFESLRKHKSIKNKIRGDITRLPFFNNTFEFISCNMVFEHLNYPSSQLTEIYRVLKPGGCLLFHTPNVHGYSTIIARLIPQAVKDTFVYLVFGRKEEDTFKAYYKINSPSKIQKIAKECDFDVLEIKMVVSTAQFVVIPLIVIFELFWIKCLMTHSFRGLRTSIIAILKKAV